MKVVIVDDERKSRETIQTLIENYCEGVTVAGTAENIEQALKCIEATTPDVLLLDISMPGGSGFDLLKRVPKITFEVIFITAYDDYGIQAIKANALDYLQKPVSIEELKQALEKANTRILEKNTAGGIKSLIDQLDTTKPSKMAKIAVPASDGLVFVAKHDIITLNAEGSYTTLVLVGGKKILSTRHLKEYEESLPPGDFIRVHHSHIINLEHVIHYQRGEGGAVSMTDGSVVIISKRKKKDFLDRFTS